MRYVLLWAVVIFLIVPLPDASAQVRHLGVVWSPPEDFSHARAELGQMHAMGVNAVRTPIIADERILRSADSLGFALYQELSVSYVPAGRLAAMVERAGMELRGALSRSRGYESTRYFGLADRCDNSDPRFRAYIQQLREIAAEAGNENIRTYYVPEFIERDRAHDLVDFVLLAALDGESAVQKLSRWRAAHPTPASIGKLGGAVSGDRRRGYRVPFSPEWQARYLEEQLRELIVEAQSETEAVFVFRFRDGQQGSWPDPAVLEDGSIRKYGIMTAAGAARPAAQVVSGIYTGSQQVFAFAPGEERRREGVGWLVVLGWAVIALFAFVYASSPLYRQMLRRYFFAHGFYCTAVREGREAFTGTNSVLLLCQSLCAGIAGTVVLQGFADTRGAAFLGRWLSPQAAEVVGMLLLQPGLPILLIGGLYALAAVLWVALFVALSGRKRRVGAPEALTVVLWPRWPMVLLMLGALLVVSLPEQFSARATAILAVFWLIMWVGSNLRAQTDLARVARKPVIQTVLLSWLPALLILGAIIYGVAVNWWAEAEFLWHLASRT